MADVFADEIRGNVGELAFATHGALISSMYKILSRVMLGKVDEPLLCALMGTDFCDERLCCIAPNGCRFVSAYLVELHTACACDAARLKVALCELGEEYDAIFAARGMCDIRRSACGRDASRGIGTSESACAPMVPFESVQFAIDEDDAEDLLDDVAAIMADESCSTASDPGLLCDHISVELEFMHVMMDRLLAANRLGDPVLERHCAFVLRAFHETHIQNWIPRFADDLAALSRSDFYKGFSLALAEVVSIDVPRRILDIPA